jgi:uncharacterized pyridoxal phosphate-containing UPF0001 family protein
MKELIEKGLSNEILTNCPDIRWHFIGNIQTKQLNKLLSIFILKSLFPSKIIELIIAIPNLYMIETVDSIEHADAVNRSWMRIKTKKSSPTRMASNHDDDDVDYNDESSKLKIMIQVNTSNEERLCFTLSLSLYLSLKLCFLKRRMGLKQMK